MWSPRTFYRVLWYSTHGMELARVLFVLAMALLFVAGGIAWSLRPPVEAEPVAFTPTDAARLRDGDPPRLVRVAAELEPRLRIYRSGGPVPYWSRCPPSRVVELDPGELAPATADRWLGCRVTVADSLADAVRNGRLTRLETQVETPEGVARWRRLIAPLEAYGPGVYVASPQLRADSTDAEAWLDRTRFTGLVAPATAFRDRVAREGYRNVSSTWLAGESRHVVVTADIDQPERAVELFSASAWAPVAGFGTRLLVEVGPAMPVAPGRPIVGVLETLAATDPEAGELLGLSLLLGEPLPEVFGVIRTASADAFNERREGTARLFIILGLLGAAAASGAVALWIVGPGLIYDAWRRAFEELEAIRTDAGSPGRPIGVRRSDLLGVGVAASSSPISPAPRQEVSATDVVARSSPTIPRFLVLVQDVSSPAGSGGWCLWRLRDDLDAAADDAANSGQRFPCLVVELLGRSDRRAVSQDEGLPAYSAFCGDLLLLRHSPRALERDRFVLVDILDGSEPDAAERTMARLDQEHVLALAVRFHLADDSEHGPTMGVEKSADDPFVRGVGIPWAGPSPDRR